LIEEGKFQEAQEMDFADLRSKFGTKYEAGIDAVKAYTEWLLRVLPLPIK
jgi:hypothetical protein